MHGERAIWSATSDSYGRTPDYTQQQFNESLPTAAVRVTAERPRQSRLLDDPKGEAEASPFLCARRVIVVGLPSVYLPAAGCRQLTELPPIFGGERGRKVPITGIIRFFRRYRSALRHGAGRSGQDRKSSEERAMRLQNLRLVLCGLLTAALPSWTDTAQGAGR